MTDLDFQFRFHPAFRIPALVFNIRPSSSVVKIIGTDLRVHFGPWALQTPLSNVESASVTTDYQWPKVIGPAHFSFADHGLTFATNPDKGVCVNFVDAVPGLDPLGLVRHPSLTVTVDDVSALAELLDRASHDFTRNHTASDSVSAQDLLAESADELDSLTASELRQRARERGLAHTTRMRKSELIDVLRAPLEPNENDEGGAGHTSNQSAEADLMKGED